MPFYLIDTHLPQRTASANADTGGMSAWVHPEPHPSRDAAEEALQRLLVRRAENRERFLTRIRQAQEDLLSRSPGSGTRLDAFGPLPERRSTQETTILEAADTEAALKGAEAEAYRRLGLPMPSVFQYFALAMRSVSRGGELLAKQVEVITGPCETRKELGDVREEATIGGTARLPPAGAQAGQHASETLETRTASRIYSIKAADRESALRGEGIGASAILQPWSPRAAE